MVNSSGRVGAFQLKTSQLVVRETLRLVDGGRRLQGFSASASARLVGRAQEAAALEREIRALDSRIDSLVYGLYGLTDDEIAIIESSLDKGMTRDGI